MSCRGSEVALIFGGIYNDRADIMQEAEVYAGHLGENFELCDYSVFDLKPPVLTYNSAGHYVPGFGVYICGGSKDYATETFPACYRKSTPSSAWETMSLPSTMNNTENHNLVALGEPEDKVLWIVGGSGRESYISNVSDSNDWVLFKTFEPKSKIVSLHSDLRKVNKLVYLVHSPNKNFTACYCSQDSTACTTAEYTCANIQTAIQPGLIHSAASFNDPETNAELAMFLGYNNGYVLSISEWSEDATPGIAIKKIASTYETKEPMLINVGGSLIALGGTNGTAITNAVSKYNTSGRWESGLPPLSSVRKYHTAVVVPKEWLCKDAPPAKSPVKSASARPVLPFAYKPLPRFAHNHHFAHKHHYAHKHHFGHHVYKPWNYFVPSFTNYLLF